MKHKKELVVLSLIAITIIGILSGASYAYFQVQQKQGEETVIESGTMALTLEDGATITADNLIPGEYIEKEFTVKNTGTLKTGYDIYLSEVVNTFVNQSDLVYEIISSNGYNTSNQVQVPNTETKIINNYNINPLEEHKYILKITYKLTNENQNDNMGRTFIAKININEYNQNNSERYIKLYDANNNEIDKQVLTNNSDYYYPLSNINLSNSTNIYCDNGGIPTIENNQLKVSEVTSETICKISNSINTTITNLPNTKTGIVMTNNQDGMTSMTLTNKEVVLDLNGKTINGIAVDTESTTWNAEHCGFRLDTSTLTLNDTIGTGGIYTGKDGRVFYPFENSNLIINGGSYNGRNSIATDTAGKNSIIINDGYFSSKMYDTIYLKFNDTLNINNGTFYGLSDRAIVNFLSSSTVNIKNGVFSSEYIGIQNAGTGIIYINGGTFLCNNSNNNNTCINIRNLSSGTININGGSFESTNGQTIYNNGGTINITDGTFESTNSQTIYNNSEINITGGIFKSLNNQTIANYKILNINKGDNFIYIAALNNSSQNAGIFNYTNSTLNIDVNKANSCTSDADDTISGMCIYSEQMGIKGDRMTMNINGGTYISKGNTIASESSNINIKNAYVQSKNINALFNGRYFVDKETGNPGIINICSSTIKGNLYDLYETNPTAYITYSNDNIFSNGTNAPDSSKVYGSINPTGAACSW